ncbi:MAG: hypothetical protein RMJ97_04305 [Raineya sp.]|nr:hypothetical protein [Raineya sp.]MDW8296087.1 hypothetical protein [Raineya sp.]
MKNICLIFVFLISYSVSAQQSVPFTLEDRDRLIKIEQRLDDMEKRFNQRFEQIDKRFEELRNDMNARFEQIDKRFEQQMNFLWILTTIFITITAAALGFAWWDRRTMIRPFETKTKAMEEKIELNHQEIKNLVGTFRELAKSDNRVAEALKQFNLL